MDILKYEVSVKNRLLPFVAAKEIADILNDIEDGSGQQEDLNTVFGNPKALTDEIKKEKRKNNDNDIYISLSSASVAFYNNNIIGDSVPFYRNHKRLSGSKAKQYFNMGEKIILHY